MSFTISELLERQGLDPRQSPKSGRLRVFEVVEEGLGDMQAFILIQGAPDKVGGIVASKKAKFQSPCDEVPEEDEAGGWWL